MQCIFAARGLRFFTARSTPNFMMDDVDRQPRRIVGLSDLVGHAKVCTAPPCVCSKKEQMWKKMSVFSLTQIFQGTTQVCTLYYLDLCIYTYLFAQVADNEPQTYSSQHSTTNLVAYRARQPFWVVRSSRLPPHILLSPLHRGSSTNYSQELLAEMMMGP